MLSDLTVTPIADTLWRLSADRRSGDLEVRAGKVVKTVFFDRGRIVFAASNLKKDRLGEALLALGRITQEQFEHASELMHGTRRRRFGEALVQSGVMDNDELGRSLARQVKRIVLSLFDLSEGVASFEERECPIPLEYMVSVSVHRLLYGGIRGMQDRELILAGLGALDRYVTLAAVPPFRFAIKKCGAEELEIIEQAQRRVTLRRLAWSDGELGLSRLRSVYALLASGVLEEADRPEGRAEQPIVQMETSTFLLSALRHQPEPSGRELVRKEVDEELRRSARMDQKTWLRVSQSAPPEELVKAIEEKMERYHALLDAVGDDEGLRTDIELILGRASSLLRLARHSAQAPPAPPPPIAAAAPAAAPRPAPETIAAPPPKIAPPAARPAPAPATIAAPAPKTPASPAPALPPVPVATPATGVPIARVEAPRPAPAAVREERVAGQSGFTGRALVEHLTMEAQVRMTVGDYAAAVESYAKLVEVLPHEPAARVRLAIAMACYPRTAKGAEREFLEAVRLAPDNADIHYHFGLYYKAMKVRARALAELRTALSLNPRHKLARQELESLSPKDSALTTLKKLFR